jgi:hypothetical protein
MRRHMRIFRIISLLASTLLLQNGGNPVGKRSLRQVADDLKSMAEKLAAHAERLADEESDKEPDKEPDKDRDAND